MPALDIMCPNCDKAMKVPDTAVGKKIRCKGCEHVFVVPEPPPPAAKALPSEFRKAAPGKAKAAKKKAEEPPPEEEPLPVAADAPLPFKDDDDEDGPKEYGVVKEGEIPRCPHCAVELDPPDTKVCLNCGFDMRQRRRHSSKKVYEHTQGDYIMHWLPAIIWLVVMIALIVVTVICFLRMRGWLVGSFLDKEEKNAVTGEPEFYIGSGCFVMVVTLITLAVCVSGGIFSYKRLVLNWRPPEVEKK